MTPAEAMTTLKVGDEVSFYIYAENIDKAVVGEHVGSHMYLWFNHPKRSGNVGMLSPSTRGYTKSWSVCADSSDLSDIELIKKAKEGGIPGMETLKRYIKKHEDFLITIAIVWVVDHFLLKGALRSKLEALVSGFLDKNGDEAKEAK